MLPRASVPPAISVAMPASSPNASTPLPPLAIIAGPTASGKSALALALAEETGGVIVNADSAQVYRDLRVLSARPSAADEARAEHRLYGTRDGALPCSAADWAAEARGVIAEVHGARRLPILVGGTGLYLRTLLEGIAPVPPIDEAIRTEVRAEPVSSNYRALLAEDLRAAAALRPTDTQRVARALEVIRSTGCSILHWQGERHGGIAPHVRVEARVVLPPRDWLTARCDARFADMLDARALSEVEALLARGLDPSLPVMNAIGVRELGGYLRGMQAREEAVAASRAATRRFAKRQFTWFRNQSPADWLRVEAPISDEAEARGQTGSFAAACRWA